MRTATPLPITRRIRRTVLRAPSLQQPWQLLSAWADRCEAGSAATVRITRTQEA